MRTAFAAVSAQSAVAAPACSACPPPSVNRNVPLESTIAAWWQDRRGRLPWTQRLSFALLPARCCACGESAAPFAVDLCDICLADLPFRPLPSLELPGVGAHACCVPFRYAEPVAGLLRQLKFAGQWPHARVLGALLAATRAAAGTPLPQALLPLPLHATRLRERGFNQSVLLAQATAQWLGIAVQREALVRTRATLPQTRLGAVERRRNLRDAFTLHDAWRDGAALPRHVALVDDVVTTGATLADAVRAVRRCGVQTVEAWAIARADTPAEVT